MKMAVDYDAIQLGLVLGKNVQTVNDLNQTVFESENVSDLNIVGLNSVELSTSIICTKSTYPSDSFILDHPVYGILDSAVLKLDGGYLTTGVLMYSGTG
jgi:hypothetical protein